MDDALATCPHHRASYTASPTSDLIVALSADACDAPVTDRHSERERRIQLVNETLTTIVGNVISDLTPRRTAAGVRVVGFRMASNERRFDKAAGEWVDGDRLYVSVTCWRKLAIGVSASLVKGDPVVVTGRLYTREYSYEGKQRSVTELEASAVGPDLCRCTADVQRVRREATADVAEQAEPQAAATEDTAQPAQEKTAENAAPALQVVTAGTTA
jgi:single-strand DNA-binding protein